MCCSGPKWKREVVPDHKFDFVDTREFTDNGFTMRMRYLWLYIIVLKSFLVYVSDVFTAITMLTTKSWSIEINERCRDPSNDCFYVDFNVARWVFFGCIVFGFLLLAYEAHKAKKIIASRDISYAFTNVMANHYYSLRSYDHFCFFNHISNSTKTSDDFAFFVFFAFKSWKRLLLSDGPRQAINFLTLYAVYALKKDKGNWYDISKYFEGNSLSTSALTVTTFFTVVVFIGSLLILIAAGICYIPLLCHIRGNLKEYCCHKVDKRIGDVIKRRQKQRLADAARLARKEAMGDYSHLKNKKGEFIAKPLPQPTLPNLSVDDDIDDGSSVNTRIPPNTYTQDYYYNSDKADYLPPMPAYNPYSSHQPHVSSATFLSPEEYGYRQPIHDDDNESTTHLAAAAAPIAQSSPIDRSDSKYLGYSHSGHRGASGSGNSYDAYEVYQGRAGHISDTSRRSPIIGGGHGVAINNDSNTGNAQHVYPMSGARPDAYPGYANDSPHQTYGLPQSRGRRGFDEESGSAYGGYAV